MRWFNLRQGCWSASFLLFMLLSACAAPTATPTASPSPLLATFTALPATETAVLPTTLASPTASLTQVETLAPSHTATSTQTPAPTETATATLAVPTPSGEDAIYAYYPQEVTASKGGKKPICQTSVVPVNTGLARTGNVDADVTTALERLFQKRQYVGGLYNPAYLSNIEVESVDFNRSSGLVSVNLTGTYVRSGDHCDDSRVREQVWNTVRQFAGVKTAYILLNGNLLGDILATGK